MLSKKEGAPPYRGCNPSKDCSQHRVQTILRRLTQIFLAIDPLFLRAVGKISMSRRLIALPPRAQLQNSTHPRRACLFFPPSPGRTCPRRPYPESSAPPPTRRKAWVPRQGAVSPISCCICPPRDPPSIQAKKVTIPKNVFFLVITRQRRKSSKPQGAVFHMQQQGSWTHGGLRHERAKGRANLKMEFHMQQGSFTRNRGVGHMYVAFL